MHSRERFLAALRGDARAGRYFDARRGRAAGDEQQRRAARAYLPELGPVAPLVLDAARGQCLEALPAQLDDHAVGMRLRLGDDPGVLQCNDSVTDVSPEEPSTRMP